MLLMLGKIICSKTSWSFWLVWRYYAILLTKFNLQAQRGQIFYEVAYEVKTQIGGFYFDSLSLLFWFDLFLEPRVEILEKISLVFWKIWRHQKDILRLTDLQMRLVTKH